MVNPTQTKQDEITFFNQYENYDALPKKFYEAVFESQKISLDGAGKTIIEIGCGSGAWGIRLAAKGFTVVGLELSTVLAKSAKQQAKKLNADFTVIVCDAEKLPIKPESIQICYCGYVLHHFKALDTLLSELNTILKPYGVLYAAEPNGSSPVIALQRKLMIALPQGWVMEKRIATSNERVHTIKKYLQCFNFNDFSNVCYDFVNYQSEEKKPLIIKLNLMSLLMAVRVVAYTVLPKHKFKIIGQANLLIFASKM